MLCCHGNSAWGEKACGGVRVCLCVVTLLVLLQFRNSLMTLATFGTAPLIVSYRSTITTYYYTIICTRQHYLLFSRFHNSEIGGHNSFLYLQCNLTITKKFIEKFAILMTELRQRIFSEVSSKQQAQNLEIIY